ncbi:hypothetical protein MRY87_05710 [bacterium]|nr:hypothetical protein [bacterium]
MSKISAFAILVGHAELRTVFMDALSAVSASVPPFEEEHRETITALYEASGGKIDLSVIHRDLFTDFPAELVEMARYAGSGAESFLSRMQPLLYRQAPGMTEYLDLALRYGDGAGEVLEVVDRAADPFAAEKELRPSLLALRAVLLEEGRADLFSKTLPIFRAESFQRTAPLLCALAPLVGEALPQVAELLKRRTDLVEDCAGYVTELAFYRGRWSASALRETPPGPSQSEQKLLLTIAARCGVLTPKVFSAVPREALSDRPRAVTDAVERFGGYVWGLFARFGHDFERAIPDYAAQFDTVFEYAREDTPALLATRSSTELSEERCHELHPRSYRLSELRTHHLEQNPRLHELLKKNTERFGIRSPHRYWVHNRPQEHLLPLLEQNIANLDLRYKPDRPIILYAVAASDHANVFCGSDGAKLIREISPLAEHARLFVCEITTAEEFALQVLRAKYLFGVDDTGAPRKPLHAVILHSHSNSSLAELREGSITLFRSDATGASAESFPNDGVLDRCSSDYFAEVGEAIEGGGKFLFTGCSPGSRPEGAESLLDYAVAEMPHVEVSGATDGVRTNSFQLAEDGRIISYTAVGREKKRVPVRTLRADLHATVAPEDHPTPQSPPPLFID